MTVQLKKGRDKPSTLTVIRADGSRTWTPLKPGFGPLHDLGHYAVESVLGLQRGFFGLLEEGRDISSFEEERDRSWIGEESVYVETVVMTLQSLHWGVAEKDRFNEMVSAACRTLDIAERPDLSVEQIDAIQGLYLDVINRWQMLAPGQTLELSIHPKKNEDQSA